MARTLTCVLLVVVAAQLAAHPLDEQTPDIVARARRAQKLVNELRARMNIGDQVRVAVVTYHPLVMSVERTPGNRDVFRLSIEMGFMYLLTTPELRSALAHELGHVWIFTHHPFLHTERRANEIALGAVEPRHLESVYRKLWWYEGSPGVPIANLLGETPRVEGIE